MYRALKPEGKAALAKEEDDGASSSSSTLGSDEEEEDKEKGAAIVAKPQEPRKRKKRYLCLGCLGKYKRKCGCIVYPDSERCITKTGCCVPFSVCYCCSRTTSACTGYFRDSCIYSCCMKLTGPLLTTLMVGLVIAIIYAMGVPDFVSDSAYIVTDVGTNLGNKFIWASPPNDTLTQIP